MTPRRSFLVVLAWLATACGGDGVHHLPDAPPIPSDGPADAAIDGAADLVALHVAKTGTGAGRVSSTPDGILCGTICDFEFARDTVVTLSAVAATDAVFTGWAGACTGATPTCDVTLAAAASVTATFMLKTFTVAVTKAGAGTGTVAGGGLSCGATCSITVDPGTVLVLDATPAALSSFAGWGGACSGSATCAITVNADTAITANFALNDVTLFVTRGGNGTGTVTSSPAAIACGATCQHTYSAGDTTTLTAVAATGSTFTGWSGGGCSGTAPCTLSLTTATTVTATFTLQTFPLTVTRAGNGSGSVTSAPPGIACGTACMALYDYGAMVTLTPAASTGSSFTGWSGSCTGTGACVVPMTAAANVTATFALNTYVLTIAKSGTGNGTVTGGAISCGSTCTQTVTHGTMITLAAAPDTTPASASSFTGWSGGGCAGTGACTVTVTSNLTVTAGFTLLPNLMFVTSTVQNGNLMGLAGADKICNTLAANAHLPGTYAAYLSTPTVAAPSRVGGATGWVRVDGKPVMNAITQFAGGTMINPPSVMETGIDVSTTNSSLVWTGTSTQGTFANACTAALAFIAWAGTSGSANMGLATSTASNAVFTDSTGCAATFRLYCLGTDRKAIAQ